MTKRKEGMNKKKEKNKSSKEEEKNKWKIEPGKNKEKKDKGWIGKKDSSNRGEEIKQTKKEDSSNSK